MHSSSYEPRTNLMKDEHGVFLEESHNISDRWKKPFCKLLCVNGVNDVKQTKIHTAELLVPSLKSVRNKLFNFAKYSLQKIFCSSFYTL
jgi:hypothetical protein